MWTAKVISVEKQPENPINIKVTVEFESGAEKIQRVTFGNDITDAIIASFVKANIVALEARDAALPNVTPGPVSVPPDLPPSDQQKFVIAANDLARLNQRVALGVVKAGDQEVLDALDLAKSLYQPGF
jgi:hypothetical protein